MAIEEMGGPHNLAACHLLCISAYFVLQSKGELMRDLDKALADILAIRTQIAAGTAFRGYGPAAMAITGALALAVTLLQYACARRSERAAAAVLRRLARRRGRCRSRSSAPRCARGRTGITAALPTR